MRRSLTALVLAGTLATATMATPTSAHAYWRGWGWGLGGLALGLTIAALARPAYAYYPAYSYGYGFRLMVIVMVAITRLPIAPPTITAATAQLSMAAIAPTTAVIARRSMAAIAGRVGWRSIEHAGADELLDRRSQGRPGTARTEWTSGCAPRASRLARLGLVATQPSRSAGEG